MKDDINMSYDASELGTTSIVDEMARVVRYTTAAVGGYLVAKGYMSAETVELVTGIVVTATPMLVGMALARLQRRHVADVIATLKASADPKGSKSDSDGA